VLLVLFSIVLSLMHVMLSVSLDCLFLIFSSIFSNIYLEHFIDIFLLLPSCTRCQYYQIKNIGHVVINFCECICLCGLFEWKRICCLYAFVMFRFYFVFSELRWEVNIRFVDIGGIVHCLSFLFIIDLNFHF